MLGDCFLFGGIGDSAAGDVSVWSVSSSRTALHPMTRLVTDMLFLGILPAEIDGDFNATLQHFLSATTMTWDQLDEYYHNLCDTRDGNSVKDTKRAMSPIHRPSSHPIRRQAGSISKMEMSLLKSQNL